MELSAALQIFSYTHTRVTIEVLKKDRNRLLLVNHPDKHTDNKEYYCNKTREILSAFEIIQCNLTLPQPQNETSFKEENRSNFRSNLNSSSNIVNDISELTKRFKEKQLKRREEKKIEDENKRFNDEQSRIHNNLQNLFKEYEERIQVNIQNLSAQHDENK